MSPLPPIPGQGKRPAASEALVPGTLSCPSAGQDSVRSVPNTLYEGKAVTALSPGSLGRKTALPPSEITETKHCDIFVLFNLFFSTVSFFPLVVCQMTLKKNASLGFARPLRDPGPCLSRGTVSVLTLLRRVNTNRGSRHESSQMQFCHELAVLPGEHNTSLPLCLLSSAYTHTHEHTHVSTHMRACTHTCTHTQAHIRVHT